MYSSSRNAAYARAVRAKQSSAKSRNARKAIQAKNRSLIRSSYAPSIQRALGFARSQYVKLRYTQQCTLSPSAAALAYAVYGANDLYSPNISQSAGTSQSTNHQPYGFDQWAAVYNEYIVLGSKITVTATPPNSAIPSTAGGLIAVLLSDEQSAYSVATTMVETGRASLKQMTPNATGDATIVTKNFSARKFWNLTDPGDNIKDYGAAVSSSPIERAYYQLYFFCNDQSATTSVGPFCWVTIDYFCLFTGPKNLSAS